MNWIKKNILLSIKVGLSGLKTNVLLTPIFLVSLVASYLVFRDSLAQNGFWVVFIPMLATLVFGLIYLIPKRNKPNHQIYYLFHLSTVSKIVLIVGALLLLGVFFFVSCQNYDMAIGGQCLRRIISR